jgi:hypothetical protein
MSPKDISDKIIKLKNTDLKLRDKLIEDGKLGEGYIEEMATLHDENARQLGDIIDIIGYPTVEKVGKEASEAAWLIIQHSIGQPAFMKRCAILLKNEVSNHKADSKNLAYLTDRIAVFEGAPQLYGTQFDWDENGKLSPYPIDDLAKVNQRRRSIGLNSLEEQIEIIRRQAQNENHQPPADLEKKRIEFNKWKRKVGWVK